MNRRKLLRAPSRIKKGKKKKRRAEEIQPGVLFSSSYSAEAQ